MTTLTGSLAYVTGAQVPASAIRRVTVKAPVPRTSGSALIATVPVSVDSAGVLTVDLEPGWATLTADLGDDRCTVELLVEAGMTTIHDAALAALAHRRY